MGERKGVSVTVDMGLEGVLRVTFFSCLHLLNTYHES